MYHQIVIAKDIGSTYLPILKAHIMFLHQDCVKQIFEIFSYSRLLSDSRLTDTNDTLKDILAARRV
jgi:hypothetical protein